MTSTFVFRDCRDINSRQQALDGQWSYCYRAPFSGSTESRQLNLTAYNISGARVFNFGDRALANDFNPLGSGWENFFPHK